MKQLDGKTVSNDRDQPALEKTNVFQGFTLVFEFESRVALATEPTNHYKEWHHVYHTVCKRWTTHAAGGVTSLDLKLAQKSDAIAKVSGQT